ncbi:MAG TPA: DsbA family protein [Nitrososphaeraceae archaeon]
MRNPQNNKHNGPKGPFGISGYRVIIMLIMGLFLLSYTMSNQYVYATIQQHQQQQQKTNNLSLSNLINQGSPYLGNISAPITIIDFSDFQCGLCARYVKATEPPLNQTYVQTDKVALVFKHLPNRGFDSMDAALAAQCTNDQGKFWNYHELLYHNQKPIDSGWVSKDNLMEFASQVPSLNMQQFEDCLDSEKYKNFIKNDLALASSFSFQDSPSFIIVNSKDGSNPGVLKGAHPFPSFKAIIDKKLTEVEK